MRCLLDILMPTFMNIHTDTGFMIKNIPFLLNSGFNLNIFQDNWMIYEHYVRTIVQSFEL